MTTVSQTTIIRDDQKSPGNQVYSVPQRQQEIRRQQIMARNMNLKLDEEARR